MASHDKVNTLIPSAKIDETKTSTPTATLDEPDTSTPTTTISKPNRLTSTVNNNYQRLTTLNKSNILTPFASPIANRPMGSKPVFMIMLNRSNVKCISKTNEDTSVPSMQKSKEEKQKELHEKRMQKETEMHEKRMQKERGIYERRMEKEKDKNEKRKEKERLRQRNKREASKSSDILNINKIVEEALKSTSLDEETKSDESKNSNISVSSTILNSSTFTDQIAQLKTKDPNCKFMVVRFS